MLRHELRHLALSVRTLLPMGVYAGCGALAVMLFLFIANKTRDAALEKLGGDTEKMAELEGESWNIAGQVLSGLGFDVAGDLAEMARDHVPPLVVFFQFVSGLFLPLLVALVSFDQFSELSTRGARFALLRVRRETYFAGKALAAIIAVAGFLLVMWLVVGTVATARSGIGEAPYALREALRAWALTCVLALPYLSLTAIVSALARPGLAFLGTFGLWIALWVGDAISGFLAAKEGATGTIFHAIEYAFPAEHGARLLSRYAPTLWTGVAGLVLIAAAGYACAAYIIRSRDV